MAKRYIVLTLFSIAFAIEEAIIVLYLRQLPASAAQTYALEAWREFCTLIVIGAIAWLAGTTGVQRARAFCFAFGIWDIVYYFGLWGLSGYPRLTEPDVLFLIPIPWVAPVWAPMAFAFVLVLIGLFGVVRERSALLVAGFVLALISFVYQSMLKTTGYPTWLFIVSLVMVLAAIPVQNRTKKETPGGVSPIA
jgi:NADH:ubiquinone oxidoreductase subunit K